MNRRRFADRALGVLLLSFATPIAAVGAQDIHAAAEAGDVARVTELLAADPALLDATNEGGLTPLHLAARHGHAELVEYLIDRGADLESKDGRGFTALLYAASSGSLDLVRLMISRGARADVVAERPAMRVADPTRSAAVSDAGAPGVSAADVAFQHEFRSGGAAMTRYLVAHGAAFDASAPVMRGIGKLDFAVSSNNLDMTRFLIEQGVDVNEQSAYPIRPLFNAAYRDRREMVELLLDAGADVNAADREGRTALLGAVTRGHSAVVAQLLADGADAGYVNGANVQNLLHIAALGGHLDIVAQLLAEGIPLDTPDSEGHTPLYYAARYGHARVYERLLESGATGVESEARFGKSPHLDRELGEGQAVAWYLNHRGWAIKTADHLLVFDAEEFEVTRPTDPALANGFLTPQEIGDQNVVALYTTYHGEIGEPAYIHEIEDSLAGITYVHQESDPWRGSDATVYQSPREEFSVGDVEIVTVQVTETMPSTGYLVKVDGLVLYYAGFRAEDSAKFAAEIDYLAQHTDHVDLAFLPLTEADETDSEVRSFVQRLDPAVVLVLDPNRRESLYPQMAERVKQWGSSATVFAAENPGDEFEYEGGKGR